MTHKDSWTSASSYEAYVGRWSRHVARIFLDWLAVRPGRAWLDVGCGTGALTEAVLQYAAPASVIGIDPSEGFIAHARLQLVDERASFRIGSALALPFEESLFDVVLSGLALNFMPDPQAGLTEMVRVTKRDGTVAAYVWDYAGDMQMMRVFWDAAVALDPAASDKDEGARFPICKPEPLASLFQRTGLAGVKVRAIDVATTFSDLDDFWTPFLLGQGPAPSYVASLPLDKRAALREALRSRLPAAADGSIVLNARAWAVQGTR